MNTFSFTPLALEHFPLLHQWMEHPHVWQWWGEGRSWSFHDVQEKYHSYTLGYKIEQGEKKAISPFVVHFQSRPIGFIQAYNAYDFPRDGFTAKDVWQNLSQSLAALDFYIGEPDCIGMGLGTEILKAFLENHVFHYFDACLVDPDKSNKGAIKAYAKAGFSTLKELESGIIMIAIKKSKALSRSK
ncbi:MAG: GNAT family N-acetyltransferase [Chlamydiia bacterium]